MQEAAGTFQVTSMGEETYQDLGGGAKLTRANGTQRFAGDIEGEGSVEWLMCYSTEGGARFLGLRSISGSIGELAGSLVIEAVGNFDGKQSKGLWTVIPGSSTGELEGLSGRGGFQASSTEATYHLEYELG
jgi:Protein of unknown function (DUF3224)